jgi:hypothetical protein
MPILGKGGANEGDERGGLAMGGRDIGSGGWETMRTTPEKPGSRDQESVRREGGWEKSFGGEFRVREHEFYGELRCTGFKLGEWLWKPLVMR